MVPQGAVPETGGQSYSVDALLTGDGFYANGDSWGPSFENVVAPGIPDGRVYSSNSGVPELIGNVWSWSGAKVFTLNMSPELASEVVAAINPAEFLVAGAEPESFGINSYNGESYGYIDYSVPVTRARFDNCVADPGVMLKAYQGYTEYGVAGDDAVIDCAHATLAYEPVDRAVESAAADQAEAAGVGKLKSGLDVNIREGVSSSLWNARVTFGELADNKPAQLELMTEFPDLETADHFLEGSIVLSARVQIPGSQDAQEVQEANVTLTLDRSSQKGGDVEANVSWNGGNYTAVVSSENFEDLQGTDVITAEFSNAEGYRLTLAGSFDENKKLTNLTGDAYVKDTDIGNVEYRKGRPVITYPNGTVTEFETLF